VVILVDRHAADDAPIAASLPNLSLDRGWYWAATHHDVSTFIRRTVQSSGHAANGKFQHDC
jgi:hypothetical protein